MDCAIYARISRDDAGTELGVTRQLDDCRRAAAARGWTVKAEYVDNDTSAYSGKARPGYTALLAAVKGGEIGAILAWNGDRLHRSLRELEDFISVVEGRRIAVAVVAQGDLDLTTSDGRAMARVVGTFARLESERKGERLRRKHEELAQTGASSGGGSRPFGYEEDHVTIRESEAALVREAVHRVLQGDSLRSIARDWNERGAKTPVGNGWQLSPLRRLLMAGRIAGIREHHVRERVDGRERRTFHCEVPAAWPAIIDRAVLDDVRRVLGDPARRTTRGEARSYLLTGMIRCGSCGRKLRARPRADGVRRYLCAKVPGSEGCGLAIIAEPLEDLVAAAIIERLDSPALDAAVDSGHGDDLDELVERLRDDEAALAQLTRDAYVERIITRAEFLAARKPLEDRIAEAKRSLAETRTTTTVAGIVGAARKAWPELSFERRRAVVLTVIAAVIVGPGRRGYNRFDASRVDVEWTS